MARRVHELAKESNLTTKDLLARMEKIGIRGRKSSSSLTEDEIERIQIDLNAGEKRNVSVGEERTVTAESGQKLVERRVGTNVIRRRATPVADAETASEAPLASVGYEEPEVLAPFAMPEELAELAEPQITPALPELPDLPPPLTEEVEHTPLLVETPEPVIVPPVVEVRKPAPAPPASPTVPRPPAMTATVPPPPQSRMSAPSSLSADPNRPRVIGKVDLKKMEADRTAALERVDPARNRRPTGTGPTPVATPAEVPTDPTRPGSSKRKKRRVIQKPEFSESVERESRTGKMARKRRALPGKEQRKTEITTPKASKRVVKIGEAVVVGDFARAMGVKAAEVVKKLMELGMLATINQVIDADAAVLVGQEFGYAVERSQADLEQEIDRAHEEGETEARETRPPVVTIMGHVDHGKTSLLDAIRKTNVTAGEAGGITQHIGAYSVDVNGKRVTFLDTPGHEAFTAMRARGAKVTDVVVLVVAADDGVMPQTIEAINHARAAAVPIVVAINKIDKPEANLEKIKQGIADHGLVPEDWGGDTVCVPVSAKTREGLPQLLELLLLQAEVLDLKANPNKAARGTIVEAKLDRGRGPVATVLVQEGTLKVGDAFLCGPNHGSVRAMINEHGDKVKEAGPSFPVEILGLTAVPEAGSPFVVVAEEATARQIADVRRDKLREATMSKTSKVTLEDLYRQIQAGDTKELKVVIKADVQGSSEALSEALSRLTTEEVRLRILHSSVGGISESDIMLAAASDAVVIGFNVRPEPKASQAADREGVDIRLYTIIYDAVNQIRDAMEGLLDPTLREKVMGRAEVRQVFTIPGVGTIAGCQVLDGTIKRNGLARVVRDGTVIYQNKVGSLRRFKEDAREVNAGYECGIGIDGYNELKVGDVIEAYENEKVARKLSAPLSTRGAATVRA